MTFGERIRGAARAVREELGARPERPRRGAALLVVMLVMAVVAAFASEYNYKAYIRMHVGANLRNEVAAYYHARGAMEVARLVVKSQNVADNMLNMISRATKSEGKQKVELYMFAEAFAKTFCEGKLELMGREIFDFTGMGGVGLGDGGFCGAAAQSENGRVGINRVDSIGEKRELFAALYREILTQRDKDLPPLQPGEIDKDLAEVALNVIDWADEDTERTDLVNGQVVMSAQAEGLGYDKGYESKDAKFDTVGELQLVDKMLPGLYCHLADKVTPYGKTKINVNETKLTTLHGLLCDPDYVSNVSEACYQPGLPYGPPTVFYAMGCVELCRTIRRVLMNPGFGNVGQFMKVLKTLPPELQPPLAVRAEQLQQKVDVRSDTIRITATGKYRGTTRILTAVIDASNGEYIHWREY